MIRNYVNLNHFFFKGYNHKFLLKKAQTPKKEETQKVDFLNLTIFLKIQKRVQYSLFPQIIFHIVVVFRIWGGQGLIALPEEYDLFAKLAPRCP